MVCPSNDRTPSSPKPAVGIDAGQTEFERAITNARAALPYVHPLRDSRDPQDKTLELQALSTILIGSFWDAFEATRKRSGDTPTLGYLHGKEPRFHRTLESYQAEYSSCTPEGTIERLSRHMRISTGDCFVHWRNSLVRGDLKEERAQVALERLETLLREGTARRSLELQNYLLSGINTARESILSTIRILPTVFERKFETTPSSAEIRQLALESLRLHRQLAAGSFDFFVVFTALAGERSPLGGEYDPNNFELHGERGNLHIEVEERLLKILNSVIDTQRKVGADVAGVRRITGCPALYAKTQAAKSNVIQNFEGWILENLDRFYFPKFKS